MKKLIALALALLVSAAAFATLTSSTTFYRFQSDPKVASDGTPTAAVVQAYWQTTVTDTATGKVIASDVSLGATWDAVANAAKTVTVGGKTYSYGEILSAVCAIAEQEKAGL